MEQNHQKERFSKNAIETYFPRHYKQNLRALVAQLDRAQDS